MIIFNQSMPLYILSFQFLLTSFGFSGTFLLFTRNSGVNAATSKVAPFLHQDCINLFRKASSQASVSLQASSCSSFLVFDVCFFRLIFFYHSCLNCVDDSEINSSFHYFLFRLKETPADLAPVAPGAYYLGPSDDGKRPGVFMVNTYKPETRYNWDTFFSQFIPSILFFM